MITEDIECISFQIHTLQKEVSAGLIYGYDKILTLYTVRLTVLLHKETKIHSGRRNLFQIL